MFSFDHPLLLHVFQSKRSLPVVSLYSSHVKTKQIKTLRKPSLQRPKMQRDTHPLNQEKLDMPICQIMDPSLSKSPPHTLHLSLSSQGPPQGVRRLSTLVSNLIQVELHHLVWEREATHLRAAPPHLITVLHQEEGVEVHQVKCLPPLPFRVIPLRLRAL